MFVNNAGVIRMKSITGVPSRIDFEDDGGVVRARISGKSGSLSISPAGTNDKVLEIGEVALKWIDILAQATNVISLNAPRINMFASSLFYIQGGLAGCSPTAITPTNLSAYNAKGYITLYTSGGAVYGLIPIV